MYRVITLKSRSGVGDGPHLLMRWKIQSIRSTFTSDADAADEHFPVTQRCIRKATCLIICGIGGTMINNDSGYKFTPETIVTHGTSMGLWLPALDINRTTAGNQWNRWNANGWNQWSSWSAGGNDDDWWSSRSQWHSEPKKYFVKSPPPEWDGNHPEKTWRDYRRTLKQWWSTTDVTSEKHGMLLWRALTGDAKLVISHFRDEDLLHWNAGQKIFEVVVQAHKHISEFEDQDDFDNAFYETAPRAQPDTVAVCKCGQGCLSEARRPMATLCLIGRRA